MNDTADRSDRSGGSTRPVAYRNAEPTDVEALVALVESAYRGESSRAGWTTEADLLGGRRTDAEAIGDFLARDGTVMRVATDGDGRIIGCCQLERRPGGGSYFGMFAVSPLLQGAGLGSGLLAEARRIAHEEWGEASMELSVLAQRRDLIAWYERAGFVPTGQTLPFPYDDRRFGLPRRDDLVFEVMVRPLP